ncbi:MAG: hypothetical protein ACHQFX_20830 [Chitinophagales bacterium]
MAKWKEDIKEELENIAETDRITASYRKRKLIMWSVRTVLSILIYVIFWKHQWVRWTLFLYIPLSIFNLVMIFGFNYILDRKIKKIKSKLD